MNKLKSLLAVLLFFVITPCFAKVPAWMLAPWDNPAPHLADLGVDAPTLAKSMGSRLVVLPHPSRDIMMPGAKGERGFRNARFVSAVARIDIPASTLRRRMHNFTDYRSIFPLMTDSTVEAMDGQNVVARYKIEIPIPALGNFSINVRVKNKLEDDGSISVMLVDGKAESLLAMLGGATDELAGQPVLVRWEFIPLNDRQSLVVMTYWDQIKLKSFFAQKIAELYPELDIVRGYVLSAGATEAIHRMFTMPRVENQEKPAPGKASFGALSDILAKLTEHGPAAVLEPETVTTAGVKKPLRYATAAYSIKALPAYTRSLSTTYSRLVEPQKELKKISVKAREGGADLGLDVRIAILLIRFSVGVDLATNWEGPDRLEFHRTAGDIARIRAAAEWIPTSDEQRTLMLVSVGHELGEDAPFILRMAHRITEQVPYADTMGMLIVQMVAMERMRWWVEKQAPLKP